MADKEPVDADVQSIDLNGDENEHQQQHQQTQHQCGGLNGNLTHLHGSCMPNEPHYHPWDQDHIVYVPMIPFGDTSTRAGACIQVTGLQPVAPPGAELQLVDAGSKPNQDDDKKPTSATINNNNNRDSSRNLAVSTRELHNEIERKRRLRIKQCCDILRRLIPGLNEKTDKATVLEHTVDFVDHLSKCQDHKCVCYHKK